MTLSIIVAIAKNNVIGKDNDLIWHLSADLKRFKSLTTGHTVLMGRKTFESIGRALPNRRNIVISRSRRDVIDGVEWTDSIDKALEMCAMDEEVYIIGGASIYKTMLNKANKLYLTLVDTLAEGDVFFPEIDDSWVELSRESHKADSKNEFDYSFINFKRK